MREFARRHARGADAGARAGALNLAVRDDFRYDPYRIDLSDAGMRASSVPAAGHGWCMRKVTPAFNLSLCERFGLKPLDFDGRSDSIYRPFDREGRRPMEYVNLRGSLDDLPLQRIGGDFAIV